MSKWDSNTFSSGFVQKALTIPIPILAHQKGRQAPVSIRVQGAGPLEWLSDLLGRLSFEFSKFRWGQSKIRQYAIWALIPLLALLVFQIVYRSRKKLRRNTRSTTEELDFNWQGLDSELYELEQKLSGRGVNRAPSEPLAEWFARMSEDPALAGQAPRITEVLNLHYRYRFDPAQGRIVEKL